jgi:hypothetical protein
MDLIIVPLFDLPMSPSDTFISTSIFTVISVARNYYVRRFVNWIDHHPQGKLWLSKIKQRIKTI